MADGDKVSLSFEYLFGNLQQTLEQGFTRLDRSIEEVRRQLDSKASNESVAALKKDLAGLELRHEQQLEKVEKRLQPLELAAASDEGVSRWKIRVGNSAVLLVSSCVGAFLYYITTLGHG